MPFLYRLFPHTLHALLAGKEEVKKRPKKPERYPAKQHAADSD
jgi:hypothetical protein